MQDWRNDIGRRCRIEPHSLRRPRVGWGCSTVVEDHPNVTNIVW
jgi:hypothetical protein